MDHNNNTKIKLTLDNNGFNDRDILQHKHVFILKAYEGYTSPISEKVLRRLQRAADQMNMINMEDLTSSFERLFND